MNNWNINKEYAFLKEEKHLGDNIIFLAVSGSNLYGTATETSDLDIRGIALDTKESLLGLDNFKQHSDKKTDTVVYSFKRFIQLLIKGSPNTIELLFAPKENILYCNEIGQLLLDNRDLFLSQEIAKTFVGYSKGMINQTRKEFASENPHRYKTLMHLFRIIVEINELLLTEEIKFPLRDCKFLKEIRKGNVYEQKNIKPSLRLEIPYDFFEFFVSENNIANLCQKSKLPEKLDLEKIEKFQMEVLEKNI